MLKIAASWDDCSGLCSIVEKSRKQEEENGEKKIAV